MVIRILIPWEDFRDPEGQIRLCRMEDERAMYNAIVNYLTRPITPEDIRSCLRMPDEWTQEQRNEFSNVIANRRSEQYIAIKFLDIALRPKEHKPCPFCGGEPVCQWHDKAVLWDVYCDNCDVGFTNCSTEVKAWAAWDRRADEKAPSVAPKLDPWYEMDKALDDHVTNGIVWKSWAELKKAEGK